MWGLCGLESPPAPAGRVSQSRDQHPCPCWLYLGGLQFRVICHWEATGILRIGLAGAAAVCMDLGLCAYGPDVDAERWPGEQGAVCAP